MILFNLFMLSCIVVFIIDLSGFVDEIISRIYKKYIKAGDYHQILPKLKPFTCSLCSTFWTGIIYLIATGTFTIALLAYVCLLSFLTPVTGDIMMLIKDALTRGIQALNELLNK